MDYLGTVWLLFSILNFNNARVLPEPVENIRGDCFSAWECCRYEFLSTPFQTCCYDHGCCPLCDKFWPKGCYYNSEHYEIGSVIEYDPQKCLMMVCVAEITTVSPFVNAILMHVPYRPEKIGISCNEQKQICVDDSGIHRSEEEEWFTSSTCRQCWCQNGSVYCQHGKWNCPLPSHPNCIAVPYGCCPKWDCGMAESTCPDPDSYGRVCVHYFDQCKTDFDCDNGEHCCLVSGCGKECMSFSHCVDDHGITRNNGESWCYSDSPESKLMCLEGSIHSVEGSCSSIKPKPESSKEVSLSLQYYSTNDCITGSGVNLTLLVEKVQTLGKILGKVPIKDVNFYVDGFGILATSGNTTANMSLKDEDIEEIKSKAKTFMWDSVVPLLSSDTTQQEESALAVGEQRLQVINVTSFVAFERNITIEDESPSLFHQVSFRRTDPISTQMAQLGYAVGEATRRFMNSYNLPRSSAAALTLLGNAANCERRFAASTRPVLELPCNPLNIYRTIDGSCNNIENDLWGASFTKYRRILHQDYGDGISSLRTAKSSSPLPSARLVSTKVNTKPNEESADNTFMLVTFGQFIDHDLTATPIGKGYLGSPIKCCDDLSVKLNSAAVNLNATKLALENIEVIEPSLSTFNIQGELNVTSNILNNLIKQGESLLLDAQQILNLENARPPRQINTATDLSIARPVNGECASIPIPLDDEFYSCHGQTCMEFVRSVPAPMCMFGPREQLNQHTAYLDGSVIYGAKKETTDSLREFEDGLMKMQVTMEGKTLLPGEEDPNDGCNIDENFDNGIFCFKAGDGRVNEQILLTFMQTVWAREHNRIARILKEFHTSWEDERLFQETRRIVIAELQHVTYNEFLPIVLGNVLMETLHLKPLPSDLYTTDYDETLDASIANSFATAAYRYGHSQIADFIKMINRHGVVTTKHLSSMFFNPFSLYEEETMEELGRGGTSFKAGKVDAFFTEEVTGNLFKGTGKFGLDLVALNIQRGRDHGLPGYTQWKELCGPAASQFSDLSSAIDEDVVFSLEDVYSAVEDIDLYIGGVSEHPFLDGLLGPTFSCIIADQFLRMKRGDRYWYEYKNSPGSFTKAQLKELHKVTFARILCNNIPELLTLQPYPFKVPSSTNPRVSCYSSLIGKHSLDPWQLY